MSPTETSRPLRADARRNRERILEAARRVFGAHGASAQIDDVAAAAGVGVGTVYRHFPTKDALFSALVAEQFAVFNEHASAAEQVGDAWDAFAGMLRAHADAMAADASARELMPRVLQDAGGGEAYREYSATAERVVARAHEGRVLREDFAVADIPMVMCGVSSLVEREVPGADWRRYLEFVLDGLRAR